MRLSPALPAVWPPSDTATTALEYFAYREEALPTGVIAYAVHGPTAKVTVDIRSGEARVETLAVTGSPKRVDPRPGFRAPAAPEQVLIDVLAGRRDMESARADLAGYLDWAGAAPVLGADIRQRKPAFFAWLAGH